MMDEASPSTSLSPFMADISITSLEKKLLLVAIR
jgi:hypothetical protein